MDETADDEFYVTAITQVLETFDPIIGTKTTMIQARKAPLQIDPDGTVTGYYGDGKEVLDILTRQFEDLFGPTVARSRIRSGLDDIAEDGDERLPERIRPGTAEDEPGLLTRLRDTLFRG